MSTVDGLIEPKISQGHLVAKFINKLSGQPQSFINRANYTFGKTLGAGTFGIVRKATNISSGEDVAVKIILKKALKGDDIQLQMIYDELTLLQHLHHPNIVEFKDWFESRDKFYIVTQLATGGELFDRILKRGKFTELDAVKIVIQMLGAIEYVHSEDVVHRDLKPENVLYVNNSENSPIVIADFGIAKRLKSNEHLLFKAAGSLGYVAPEVLSGDGHGKPCDIWSIGVITYTLLCGYSPFIAESVDGFLEECTRSEYAVKFHEPYWNDISNEAKNFILRALTINPDERPTASELLEDPWITDKNLTRRTTDIMPNIKKGFDLRGKLRNAIEIVKLENRIKRLRNLYVAESDMDDDLQETSSFDTIGEVAESMQKLSVESTRKVTSLTQEQLKLQSALAQNAFAQIVRAATNNKHRLSKSVGEESANNKSDDV